MDLTQIWLALLTLSMTAIGTMLLFILKEIKADIKDIRRELADIRKELSDHGSRLAAIETSIRYMEWFHMGHEKEKVKPD